MSENTGMHPLQASSLRGDWRYAKSELIMVRIADYPQLNAIAWNRPNGGSIDEAEALALYERNWEYVDNNALTPREEAFVQELATNYGNGCFAHV